MSRAASYYRRPLPAGQIAFSSDEGKRLFREALAAGSLEGFFSLSEQFHTQAEPAYCGLGSLVMGLNALGIDPGRLWKGPWRWFDESLLDCCVPLDEVRARGLTLGELGCLAACNGASATVVRAGDSSVEALRAALLRAARSTDRVVIAAYDRGTLGQAGQGHFSPVGGVHVERDLALLLDVARFKYPPHWVAIEQLFDAMLPMDPATQRSRGWIELVAAVRPRPIFLQLGLPVRGWAPILGRLADEASDHGASIEAWTASLAQHLPELGEIARTLAHTFGSELEPEHQRIVDVLIAQVRATRAYRAVIATGGADPPQFVAEAIAVLALVLAPDLAGSEDLGPPLGDEIAALRDQVAALCDGGRGATMPG